MSKKKLIGLNQSFILRQIREDISFIEIAQSNKEKHHPSLKWIRCDLFSLKQIFKISFQEHLTQTQSTSIRNPERNISFPIIYRNINLHEKIRPEIEITNISFKWLINMV